MKSIILVLTPFLFFMQATAQNVGIGTGAPHSSARLEISDTARGILIPRLDSFHRVNIINPAAGLMVYETNSSAFWFFSGLAWMKVGTGAVSTTIADQDGNTSVATEKNANENMIRFSLNANERWVMKNAGLEAKNNSSSIYIGNGAGMSDDLTAPKFNIAVGDSALSRANTGFNNIAIGHYALYSNSAGNDLVAIGDSALYHQAFDSTGSYANTAIGSGAMYFNTTGHSNTATGKQSLYSNVSGKFNVASGKQALFNNIDGVDNTAIGHQAMYFNTSGSFNAALGDWCLRVNTTGMFNTAAGIQALYNNSSGNQNTAQGALTLTNNSTGNFNTASGYFAGLTNTTGNNNTLIGSFADVSNGSLTNAGAIGYNAKVAQSNSFVIGGTGADAVNVGIGTAAPTERLDVQGNIKATGTITPSDMRFKKNILPLQNSLQKVLLLNGVSYDWRTDDFMNRGFDTLQQLGFIAQDIEKIFPQIVRTGNDGYKGVDYTKLIPVLVEAIKEQNAVNEQLKARLQKLESRLR